VLFRAAAYEPASPALLSQLETQLGLAGEQGLRYADPRRGQHRAVRLVGQGSESRLDAFLLAGDTRSQAWIRALLQDELDARSYGRLLLAPGAKPPLAIAPKGRQVCACLDVSEPAIQRTLASCHGTPEERLARVQQDLRCGTQCGSCVPELKRLVKALPPQPTRLSSPAQ
jgi:assimilatory nitrate reductase catalytic subunit